MGVQTIIGGFLSIVVYGMLMAAVVKLFTISSDLAEIKELLKKGKDPDRAAAPWADPIASPQPIGKWSVVDE